MQQIVNTTQSRNAKTAILPAQHTRADMYAFRLAVEQKYSCAVPFSLTTQRGLDEWNLDITKVKELSLDMP
jgi:hypothetical protein